MQQDVTSVYRGVIDDVMAKVKPEFVQAGTDESLLDEIRVLWEAKLMQSGALTPIPLEPVAKPPPKASTAARLQQAEALSTPDTQGTYLLQGSAFKYEELPAPGLFVPGVDRTMLEHQRKRKLEGFSAEDAQVKQPYLGEPQQPYVGSTQGVQFTIGQADGQDDPEGDGEEAEATEEDDLGDVDSDSDDTDKDFPNLMVAQFEKVNRTKNRWKCHLKDGIMHLNGSDVLFSKAVGEMEF